MIGIQLCIDEIHSILLGSKTILLSYPWMVIPDIARINFIVKIIIIFFFLHKSNINLGIRSFQSNGEDILTLFPIYLVEKVFRAHDKIDVLEVSRSQIICRKSGNGEYAYKSSPLPLLSINN